MSKPATLPTKQKTAQRAPGKAPAKPATQPATQEAPQGAAGNTQAPTPAIVQPFELDTEPEETQDTEIEAEESGGPPEYASDADAALAILRRIRDTSTSTTTEKINAIRGIAALLGRDDIDGRGPGMMTRDEIARELDRLKLATQG